MNCQEISPKMRRMEGVEHGLSTLNNSPIYIYLLYIYTAYDLTWFHMVEHGLAWFLRGG